MQRARATEGKQREVPRVVSLGEADHADRTGHLVVGDPQDGGRRGDGIEPERTAELRLDDALDVLHAHRVVHAEQLVRVQSAEQQVGVRDRGLRAAAPVADGAGLRARAARADLQHARFRNECDRSAACADRVHVHHRHVDRHRILDLELGRDGGHAVLDQADVGGRASHVVGDHVGHARGGGRVGRGDDAGGGAGHHGVHRSLGDQAGRDRAAVALHHQEVARKAARLQFIDEALDVAVEDRLD